MRDWFDRGRPQSTAETAKWDAWRALPTLDSESTQITLELTVNKLNGWLVTKRWGKWCIHIKQHKNFGGICISSVIMLEHGKLKFLLASPFAFSLPPGSLILSPVNELLEEKVVWGGRKQRERWESRMKGRPSEGLSVPQWGTGLSLKQERLF